MSCFYIWLVCDEKKPMATAAPATVTFQIIRSVLPLLHRDATMNRVPVYLCIQHQKRRNISDFSGTNSPFELKEKETILET